MKRLLFVAWLLLAGCGSGIKESRPEYYPGYTGPPGQVSYYFEDDRKRPGAVPPPVTRGWSPRLQVRRKAFVPKR
jgi:hypothetical protein